MAPRPGQSSSCRAPTRPHPHSLTGPHATRPPDQAPEPALTPQPTDLPHTLIRYAERLEHLARQYEQLLDADTTTVASLHTTLTTTAHLAGDITAHVTRLCTGLPQHPRARRARHALAQTAALTHHAAAHLCDALLAATEQRAAAEARTHHEPETREVTTRLHHDLRRAAETLNAAARESRTTGEDLLAFPHPAPPPHAQRHARRKRL
ncbi:hypothetical protein [Streptomyces sp. H27-D2]|uniref:hypothetical protein n=1 Tax=Streptomyces sp. H27-D2 TaxID=3046304 RepID=UPI002DBDEEF2|nr:hypothetical protein [Streptomyces sp. H27-D2]MEC4019758.1 hypothetical protein [Streptomyces sp. H27-D2]